MTRFARTASFAAAGLAALATLALAPGCDWLSGSESGSRSSPYLSGLSVSRSSVLCGTEFTVSFRYDDPQGDLYQVNLTLQHEDGSANIDASQLWPEDISKSAGTASFPLEFSCDDPGGRYTLSVSTEDEGGHKSNVLSSTVTLSSAG